MYELFNITTLVIRQMRQVVGEIKYYFRIIKSCLLWCRLTHHNFTSSSEGLSWKHKPQLNNQKNRLAGP